LYAREQEWERERESLSIYQLANFLRVLIGNGFNMS